MQLDFGVAQVTERPSDSPRPRWACTLVAALAGCAAPAVSANRTASSEVVSPATAASAPAGRPSAPPASAGAAAASQVVRHGLDWFHDAPEAAFELARREKKPLVVDLWASWCHTCLSMQEYVLTDTKLPGVKDRYVFLAIDTELPENAAFLQKLAVSVWPTFYVLAPEGGEIRGRWLGAATPAQFARFLSDAERSIEAARAGQLSESDPLARLLRADELAGNRQFAAAAEQYRAALRDAPNDWRRRPEAQVALASALKQQHEPGACTDAYLSARPALATAPVSSTDLASTGLACVNELPASDARVARVRKRARAELETLCSTGHPELTPDDRGDACGLWIEVCEAMADAACAKRAAETRLALLEAAARDMPDEVAAIYDFARSDTLVKLGRGPEALALLEARERALPRNYNPPHQLARAYRQLKRWQEGLAAIDRALALAYGPRRVSLLGVKVDLLLGADRKAEGLRLLGEQLAAYRALPDGQKRPEAERKVAQRLSELAATPPP